MRTWCLVLIAAVTVNCLVTTINAKGSGKNLVEPFNMLLPPLADKAEDATKPLTTTKAAAAATVAPLAQKAAHKPAAPELSIDALLPPLFDANIEKAESDHKAPATATTTTTPAPATPKPTTTVRPTTTTTTKTTVRTTTTPRTTTTAAKSVAVEPPSLFLDALLPPLDSESVLAPPTPKPVKQASKKSQYQQQTQQAKLQGHSADAYAKPSYTPQANAFAKTVKEKPQTYKSQAKPAPQRISSSIEAQASQHVQAHLQGRPQQQQQQRTGDNSFKSTFDRYSFDRYFGSTTPRPPKHGLPTITPFPHRLR